MEGTVELRSGRPMQMFGYGKGRYRSLGKSKNRLALLLGFAILLGAESCMV